MIDISPELQEAFKANQREIISEVIVNFSDISLNPSAQVTSAENNIPNFNSQIINGNTSTACKWLCMEGIGDMSGDWCMIPADTEQDAYQVGLWSTNLVAADGSCNVTYNIIQNPKDISTTTIYAENNRLEHPVDFSIKWFSTAGLQYTDTVIGNTLIVYESISPTVVEDINKIEVNITKWSTPLTPVKILATLTSLEKTFTSSDIISYNIQEESEILGTSSIPTGNISYSMSDFTLLNRNRIFDINNTASPLYQQIKPNSKIDVFLGARTVNGIEKIRVFSGWTEGFNAPEKSNQVTTQAYDRLKRLSLTFMSPTALQENRSVGELFELILIDADISSEFYQIDTRLYDSKYTVPVYFISSQDHLSELRRLSEAVSTSVYVKNDVINVDSIEAISFKFESQETYDQSDYTDKTNEPLYDGIYNTIKVPYTVYSKSTTVELYATPTEELESIESGDSTVTFVLSEKSCVEQIVNYAPVAGVTITSTSLYSDRVVLGFNNTNPLPTDISLTIDGKFYSSAALKTIEKSDQDSIQEYGRNDFTFPENEILQTSGLATVISTNLLATFKDPFRDASVEFQYAGNPALELTDKITIQDKYLDQGYNIVSKKTSYDGGLSLSFKCRKAALKDSLLIDNNGNEFIDDLGNEIICLISDIVDTFDLIDDSNNEFITDNGSEIIVGG